MTLQRVLANKAVRGGAAAFVILWLSIAGWYGYDAVLAHPVRNVVFGGSTARLSPAELEALARSIQESPERPSPASVREAARHMHWVRDAFVRRVSVDTIEIRFEIHEPFARWNDDALVNRQGEVFAAEFEGPLPRFRGTDPMAPRMAHEYPLLAAAIEPLGSAIAELRLTPRGAWQATLESGLVLELGRSDMEARIARLVSAWPELAARGVTPSHADLRYANGFALRRPDPLPKEAAMRKK